LFQNKNPKLKAPLIIYLHGAGGKGNDINVIKRQVMPLLKGIQKFTKEQCIIIAPQCLKKSRNGGRGTWKVEELNLFLEQLKKTLPVDANRIYLTGNSFGGYGLWLWGGIIQSTLQLFCPSLVELALEVLRAVLLI
jgi:predicted peptidase